MTPSDTADDAHGPFAFLYVGGTGAVTANTMRGDLVTWSAVPAGTYIWCAVRRIRASGTTATLIVGHCAMPYPAGLGV